MSRSLDALVPGSRLSAALLVSLVSAALLVLASPARAEDPASSRGRLRSWSFELVSGLSFGGPVDDLEEAMRRAGFDDSVSWSWLGSGSASYPRAYDDESERISYWGAARRRLGSGPWHVGLGGGATDFGSVTGYRATSPGGYTGTFLDADTRMVTLAAMSWYEPVRALRLGAGPALHRVDLELGYAGSSGSTKTRSWNAGFVVEAALTVPVDTPVFFVALAQYRWGGSATAGPWEGTSSPGVRVEFPKTSVNVSHAFVALGIGGRF